jgi:hypothetical protein
VPFWHFVFLLIFRSRILVSVIIRGTALHIVTMLVWQTVNLKRNRSHKSVTLSRMLQKTLIATAQDNRKFEEQCRLCYDAMQSGRNLPTFGGTVFTRSWP